MKLEDLQPNATIHGILPDSSVTVVSVQWLGSEALELTYKTATGKVANELIYRDREPTLEIVEQGRPWSFDGDGSLFRLVAEAERIFGSLAESGTVRMHFEPTFFAYGFGMLVDRFGIPWMVYCPKEDPRS